MPQDSTTTNESIVLSQVINYRLVEMHDKQNSFFLAVLLALLTQPELYSSIPSSLFDRDQVFKDWAFEEVCNKCFPQISIIERQQIKNLIEQFKRNGDLTFIVRNLIFQQAIGFLRKKSEACFKEHLEFFSTLFSDRYAHILKSISSPGRFPNEGDIKALAIGLDYEIVVTSSTTQRIVRYSVNPRALTSQKPLSEVNVCPIYLEDQAQKGYAFGMVDQSILKEKIDRYQQSLVTYPRYLLKTAFIHFSRQLWQINQKIYALLRVPGQVSSFGPLALAYWQQTNKRLSLSVPSLRDFFLRLERLEENINAFLLENKHMNIKKSKAGVLFQNMMDHLSELDGCCSAMMMWSVLGVILLPCLPAIRISFTCPEELTTVSFLSFQQQPFDQYNWQYQEILIKKTSFDSALEWLVSSKTPFRQAFIAGSFVDIANYSLKIKRIYPLLIFGLFFAFFSAHPEITQAPSFINIEVIIQILYLMSLGMPYLMYGIGATSAAPYLLFQKTNQTTTKIMSKANKKARQTTLGCFFKTADEPENEEIFLGNTIIGRLFNQADEMDNDKNFIEDTQRATTSSQSEANVLVNRY